MARGPRKQRIMDETIPLRVCEDDAKDQMWASRRGMRVRRQKTPQGPAEGKGTAGSLPSPQGTTRVRP